jgi:DNA repair ATPase RecN
MHYKGTGKHSVEELEEIIDEIRTKLIDLEFDHERIKSMHNELSQFIRDMYYAASELEKETKLTGSEVAKNIKKNIEEFSRQYGFSV